MARRSLSRRLRSWLSGTLPLARRMAILLRTVEPSWSGRDTNGEGQVLGHDVPTHGTRLGRQGQLEQAADRLPHRHPGRGVKSPYRMSPPNGLTALGTRATTDPPGRNAAATASKVVSTSGLVRC